MPNETDTQTTATQSDAGKTSADAKAADAKAADTKAAAASSEDKGSDDVEALKKHNKALLTELTNKKSELNDYKGKYESLQSEKETREADELKQQGQYKELLEKEQVKNQSYQKQVLKAQLQAFAFKEGIIDDDVIDVIPTDKIKITAVNDSIQISGAEEAVKAYKASKPHLFKAPDAAAAADATAKTSGSPTGAAVADPKSAGNTTNAIASGVKPGSKEAQELERAFLEKHSR